MDIEGVKNELWEGIDEKIKIIYESAKVGSLGPGDISWQK